MAKATVAVANDDIEMEKIAEDELCKLQRQHRIMEIDRGSVTSGAQQTLRMQRNLIRILTQELESIMMELKMLKSTSNVMQAGRARDQLVALLKDHEYYSDEVKKQKTNIQELDFLVKQVEKEIKSLQTAGNKSEEECAKTLTNRTIVRQLENRLDTAMKKFNSVNSDNHVMRMEIDSLLRDRHTFNTDWKNQLKRLMDGKTQILELVEQAIITYDQREEWCSKLEALKERAAVDYRRHCLEVRELQRQLDHSLKLEEFLRTKGTVRLTGADAKAEARRLQKEEEETKLYNNYVNILEAIKEFAGENDVEKLMQEYTRRDEENYALFNYINEVNTELKNLHDSVKMLRKNIVDENEKHEAKKQKESDSVESLTAALEEKRQTAAALKEEVDKSNDVQQDMLQQIYELAQSADCKNLSLLKLLGNRKSVYINEHNAKLYFKSLEKRIMEINNLIKIDEILQRQEALLSERSPATSSRRRRSRTPRKN